MVVRCPGAMHSCDGAAWQRRQARTTATRPDTTYNLKYRNCSSSVSRALEAAIEGASARVWGGLGGGRPFLRGMTAPELWVAAQLRERAATMAWTPGLTLDYARRPASVGLGEDGAPRRAPHGALAAAMA